MKKSGVIRLFVLIILILSFFPIVHAQTPDNPTAGLESATGGALDQEGIHTDNVNVTGYKSKAEVRIDQINQYVGPISKLLFGVELSLSWVFVFSIVMWLLIVSVIYGPTKNLLRLNVLFSLFGAMVLATLVIKASGNRVVSWITTTFNLWYTALGALIASVIVMLVYLAFMKAFGKKIKEEKKRSDEERRETKAQAVEKKHDVEIEELPK